MFSQRFLFDTQGWLCIPGLLGAAECAAMREHYRKFLWDEQHGTAYEQTMKALAQAAADIVG